MKAIFNATFLLILASACQGQTTMNTNQVIAPSGISTDNRALPATAVDDDMNVPNPALKPNGMVYEDGTFVPIPSNQDWKTNIVTGKKDEEITSPQPK